MNIKATRKRMISCFAQIINDYVLGYKIPELVKNEKIKARKLSYDSQMYLLMLGQFLHVFSLNELVDISKIYAKELSRIRGITSANLNTFSNANRTRNPSVMEKFFWMMYDHFRKQDEAFVRAKHTGRLSRFKLRNIYAIDSSTIKLAQWCIQWAKHRQHKAAVKVHMVANVASRLPHFCVYGKANEHDSKKEEILFESLNAGDIGILDRAYNCFETLYKQSQRGVIFVVREKEAMLHEIVEEVEKKDLAKNIIADEVIRLTGVKTKESYPTTLRRVTAHVEINKHCMTLFFSLTILNGRHRPLRTFTSQDGKSRFCSRSLSRHFSFRTSSGRTKKRFSGRYGLRSLRIWSCGTSNSNRVQFAATHVLWLSFAPSFGLKKT